MLADDYWNKPLVYLKKVGPKRAEVLALELGLHTHEDLLHCYPARHMDRSHTTSVASLQREGEYATLTGRLGAIQEHSGKKRWITAEFTDDSGMGMELVWFNQLRWVQEKYSPGQHIAIFGRVTFGRNHWPKMVHPEVEVLEGPDAEASLASIIPFYSSTEKMKKAGLDARGMRQIVAQLLADGLKYVDETLPAEVLLRWQLMPRQQALRYIHFPENMGQLAAARRRLKFEELFYFQVLMARKRLVDQPTHPAIPFGTVGQYFNLFYKEHLPFSLTEAQKRVVREIRADTARPVQMNRLLQGDVGSGKTMVAVMAMLLAADNGCQAAMLAPTEILAQQHYINCQRYLAPLGLQVGFLAGSTKKKEREALLAGLAEGSVHLLTGTHALLEPQVVFLRLGLTVIDEQHKFGVMQRAALWNKCPTGYPHHLAMSATPIPRTLAMTLYGDLQVSVLDELPPGRTPVKTVVMTEEKRLRMLGFVVEQLKQGRQAYVVFPLVEESQASDLLAAVKGYDELTAYYGRHGYSVGMVHGKMKAVEKEATMAAFKAGRLHVLVSTTVIEVGVDVPNATIMVVENAERFGLAQLHQLRGRVGRGAAASFCILMAFGKLSYPARRRLSTMAETTDGFRIAEVDLELRGPGDVLGTRQSGLPDFKLADLAQDADLVEDTRTAADWLMTTDPQLALPRHQATRRQVQRYSQVYNLPGLNA